MEEASGWRGFLKPTSDEVPFKITICGIEELSDHRDVGVSHVLSILDPSAPQPPAFGSFGEHERVELRFDDVIEDSPDHVVPSRRDVEAILAFGRNLAAEPTSNAHLLVHCHMGISRSTAAMTLILAQARPDLSGDEILTEVLRIRSSAPGPISGSSNWATHCSVGTVRSWQRSRAFIASNFDFDRSWSVTLRKMVEEEKWKRPLKAY